jgi:hypothetical protein
LYSVLPADGVGDFTFSRGSAATRINKDGLIETVASGVSRLNYPLIDGVVNGCPSHLLEPSRLQRIQYSEDFSQWIADRVLVSNNQIISPNGILNADKISENSENNVHRLYSNTFSAVSGSDYSISVFAKKGTATVLQLGITTTSVIGTGRANFDLQNGVLGSVSGGSAIIENYGNGWYKCIFTFESLSTASAPVSFLLTNNDLTASRNPSYTGNTNQNIYIYGAQVEQGSYPTSYIPNYGTSAGITRVAETANGAGDASTFNDSEGVLMAEISALEDDLTFRRLTISDNSYNNTIDILLTNNSNEIRVLVRDNTVTTSQMSYTVNSVVEFNKIAFKYKSTSSSLWVNGLNVVNIADIFTLPFLTDLSFDRGDGTSNFYGNIKQIQYFDSALNDSDLETLTSWTSFTDMANGQLYSIK